MRALILYVILSRACFQGRAPTEVEVCEFAMGALGLDPLADAELLWIARECLVAPLPAVPFVPCFFCVFFQLDLGSMSGFFPGNCLCFP